MSEQTASLDRPTASLRSEYGLYYGGAWHRPAAGAYTSIVSPSTGRTLTRVASATSDDVNAAVTAAQVGFAAWRAVPPLERAKALRAIGQVIRRNAHELALLDATNGGNPVRELRNFMEIAADSIDFFAGLVTEIKGDSIPMGPGRVNFTVREPFGVVARIVAFNHPLMFTASRLAAPLAAGNAVIMKPSAQAPLSALRLGELVGDLLPPGVLSFVTGEREAGAALASHPGVAMISLIGSVPTGRAVMRAAAETLKPVLLELGGKNALIAYPDADPDEVAAAAVAGMNFGWAGQSCGSTSRVFLHDDIHDAVVERVKARCAAYRPGLATDPETTMGALISKAQFDRVMGYIELGKAEGARLQCGGGPPSGPTTADGFFIEPTMFVGVTQDMRIASEEIFGPVLSVLRWNDERAMLADVNRVEYGLTCSIWTRDIDRALRVADTVQAGFVWINEVAKHFVGAPFGGVKQSGIGREECLGELIAFTQEKNIHVRYRDKP
jgi:betaine-aldehyde dehydrogenase